MAPNDAVSDDPENGSQTTNTFLGSAQHNSRLTDLGHDGTVSPNDNPPRFAATVICVRSGQTDPEPEVLMARRDTKLTFAGGMWVFPGGKVDPEDYEGEPDPSDSHKLDAAERRAAVREVKEEVNVDVDESELIRYSHWTPPQQALKRYLTSFFLVPFADDRSNVEVVVDDSEIREYRWLPISGVLSSHAPGTFDLAPPTFITLTNIAGHGSLESLVNAVSTEEPESFATRFGEIDGIGTALYHGDCAYEAAEDPRNADILGKATGAKHRLWMDPAGWHYERTAKRL